MVYLWTTNHANRIKLCKSYILAFLPWYLLNTSNVIYYYHLFAYTYYNHYHVNFLDSLKSNVYLLHTHDFFSIFYFAESNNIHDL